MIGRAVSTLVMHRSVRVRLEYIRLAMDDSTIPQTSIDSLMTMIVALTAKITNVEQKLDQTAKNMMTSEDKSILVSKRSSDLDISPYHYFHRFNFERNPNLLYSPPILSRMKLKQD